MLGAGCRVLGAGCWMSVVEGAGRVEGGRWKAEGGWWMVEGGRWTEEVGGWRPGTTFYIANYITLSPSTELLSTAVIQSGWKSIDDRCQHYLEKGDIS